MRTINHVERVSDSFDSLPAASHEDVLAELFTRLLAHQKQALFRRLEFHMKMAGLLDREPRRRQATPVPALSDPVDVEEIGAAAIARTEPKKGGPVQ